MTKKNERPVKVINTSLKVRVPKRLSNEEIKALLVARESKNGTKKL